MLLLAEMLKMADLTRLEVHGPAAELALLSTLAAKRADTQCLKPETHLLKCWQLKR
jgi:hypothetical protein